MRLWRLSTARLAASAFDGEGARLVGGRWNSPGRRVVYLSQHLSLAVLEVLVHVSRTTAPEHVAIAIDVPEDVPVYRPDPRTLPADWRQSQIPDSTRLIGDAWLERGSEPLMRVPSVIVPDEFNFVMNPAHPDCSRFRRHAPVRFSFDPRLLKG